MDRESDIGYEQTTTYEFSDFFNVLQFVRSVT